MNTQNSERPAKASILGHVHNWIRRHRALFGFALATSSALAAVTLSTSSCSLLVRSTTATQCASNADCAGLGPAHAGHVCNPTTNFCVPPAEYCTTNAECNAPGATTGPAICRKSDHTCQTIGDPDNACYGIMDGAQGSSHDFDVVPLDKLSPADYALLNDDNAILIGFMNDTTPNNGLGSTSSVKCGIGSEITEAYIVSKLYSQLRGIPVATPGAPPRPLIGIACSEGSDGTKSHVKTATHLAKDLQVPVILGPRADKALDTAPIVMANGGAEVVLGFSQFKSLRQLPNSNLLIDLATSGSTGALATAMMDLAVEPLIRKQASLSPESPIKVTVLTPTDGISQAQLALYQEGLSIGGKSFLQLQGEGSLQIVNLGTDGNDLTLVGEAVKTTVASAPHLILILGHAEQWNLISLVEAAWDPNAAYKPWYMASDEVGTYSTFDGPTLNKAFPDVRRRLFINQPIGSPGGRYANSLVAWFGQYLGLPGRAQQFPACFGGYISDNTVMSIIAIMAAVQKQTEPKPLTGADVIAGFAATQPPNHPQELSIATPEVFRDALNGIRTVGGINYDGQTGPLDLTAGGDAWSEMCAIVISPYLAVGGVAILGGNLFVSAPPDGVLWGVDRSGVGNACSRGDGPTGCYGGKPEGSLNLGFGTPVKPGVGFDPDGGIVGPGVDGGL